MRILDVDLQKVLMNMSDAQIDVFFELIKLMRVHGMDHFKEVPNDVGYFYFFTKELRTAAEKIVKSDLSDSLDDERLLQDELDKTTDENEKFFLRDFMNNHRRFMSKNSIEKLVDRVKLMKKREKYAEQFKNMSLAEIEKKSSTFWAKIGQEHYIPNISSQAGVDEYEKHLEELQSVDPEYGINAYEKTAIEELMTKRAFARELVANIPIKKFRGYKRSFENAGFEPYSISFNSVIKNLVGENLDYELEVIDLGEAFDEREKQLETQKNKSFFEKLKNFFRSFGKKKNEVKALPEATIVEKKDDFMQSISVSQDQIRKKDNLEQSVTRTERDNEGKDHR